jgi:hypothetical protein
MGRFIKKKQNKMILTVVVVIALIGVAYYAYSEGYFTLGTLGNLNIMGNKITTGSSPLVIGDGVNDTAGTFIGVRKAVFATPFTLTSFYIYAKSNNNYTQACKFVLYSDSNNKPSNLLYYKPTYFNVRTELNWYTTTLSATFPAGTYWFGALCCNPIQQYTLPLTIKSTAFYIATNTWPIPLNVSNIGTLYSLNSCSYVTYTIASLPKTITVTSPNGGELWTRGSTHAITWTSTGSMSNVKIELYKAGNLTNTITTSTANTGSYLWVITDDFKPAVTYKIKITYTLDSTVCDYSDNYFAIA